MPLDIMFHTVISDAVVCKLYKFELYPDLDFKLCVLANCLLFVIQLSWIMAVFIESVVNNTLNMISQLSDHNKPLHTPTVPFTSATR